MLYLDNRLHFNYRYRRYCAKPDAVRGPYLGQSIVFSGYLITTLAGGSWEAVNSRKNTCALDALFLSLETLM